MHRICQGNIEQKHWLQALQYSIHGQKWTSLHQHRFVEVYSLFMLKLMDNFVIYGGFKTKTFYSTFIINFMIPLMWQSNISTPKSRFCFLTEFDLKILQILTSLCLYFSVYDISLRIIFCDWSSNISIYDNRKYRSFSFPFILINLIHNEGTKVTDNLWHIVNFYWFYLLFSKILNKI